jgi:hypothetical protein
MPIIVEDEIALTSLLFGALSHERLCLLSKSRNNDNPRLAKLEVYMHQTEAVSVSLISKALRQSGEISDAILVAVLW